MSFKAAREKANISQAAIAKAFSVSRAAVSLWDSGKRTPTASKLVAIAKMFGCSVEELLNE